MRSSHNHSGVISYDDIMDHVVHHDHGHDHHGETLMVICMHAQMANSNPIFTHLQLLQIEVLNQCNELEILHTPGLMNLHGFLPRFRMTPRGALSISTWKTNTYMHS